MSCSAVSMSTRTNQPAQTNESIKGSDLLILQNLTWVALGNFISRTLDAGSNSVKPLTCSEAAAQCSGLAILGFSTHVANGQGRYEIKEDFYRN